MAWLLKMKLIGQKCGTIFNLKTDFVTHINNIMNIKLRFVVNSTVFIVLFPTNKMLVVTKIVIEKHCDKVLLRNIIMLIMLNPLKLYYLVGNNCIYQEVGNRALYFRIYGLQTLSSSLRLCFWSTAINISNPL